MKYIKHIIFLIAFLTFQAAAAQQLGSSVEKIWKDPAKAFGRLDYVVENGAADWETADVLSHELQNLAYIISQEINSAESPDWANPSTDRVAVIQRWGKFLKPYTERLIKLALSEDPEIRQHVSRQARSLLDYATPDEAFGSTIRAYLHLPLDTTARALDLLFEHRLLVDDDRANLLVLKKLLQDSEERMTWAICLSEVGMTEGIELARERLISDPMSTDPIKNRQHYDAVFTIVGNLGTKAAPLLPDLEAKRVWAIKNAPEVFKSFEASVAVAKGELPSKVRTAVNGSGVLLKSGVQPPLQLGTAKKVMGINSIFGKWVWIAVVVVLLFFGFFNVRMKRKRNDSPGRL